MRARESLGEGATNALCGCLSKSMQNIHILCAYESAIPDICCIAWLRRSFSACRCQIYMNHESADSGYLSVHTLDHTYIQIWSKPQTLSCNHPLCL